MIFGFNFNNEPSEICKDACKDAKRKLWRTMRDSQNLDAILKTGINSVKEILEETINFEGVNSYIYSVSEFNGRHSDNIESLRDRLSNISISTKYDKDEE